MFELVSSGKISVGSRTTKDTSTYPCRYGHVFICVGSSIDSEPLPGTLCLCGAVRYGEIPCDNQDAIFTDRKDAYDYRH